MSTYIDNLYNNNPPSSSDTSPSTLKRVMVMFGNFLSKKHYWWR